MLTSFPVGTVSLIVALLVALTEALAVTGLGFEPRETPFQQQARLGQGQGRGFVLVLDLEANQEQLRREHHAHLPMPSGPRAVFVAAEAQLGFAFFKAAFNRPARPADSNQFLHRGLLGSVAQGIFDLPVAIVAHTLKATARLKKAFPEARVIMLTQFDTPEYRAAACRAGALHFLCKDRLRHLPEFMLA